MMTYGYSEEELDLVKERILKALEEKGIKVDKIEVVESCRFNLKAEILIRGSTKFSMDDLSHIARKVAETGLGAMTYADGEEFPLDFEVDVDDEGLRLTLWF